MNRKQEEELIQQMFSESTESESSQVDKLKSADAHTQVMAQQYKQMREDLKLTREVPADQLSKERLREAILKAGLSASGPANRQKWVWPGWIPSLTASACAVVGVYFVFSHSEVNPSPTSPSQEIVSKLAKQAELPVASRFADPSAHPLKFEASLGGSIEKPINPAIVATAVPKADIGASYGFQAKKLKSVRRPWSHTPGPTLTSAVANVDVLYGAMSLSFPGAALSTISTRNGDLFSRSGLNRNASGGPLAAQFKAGAPSVSELPADAPSKTIVLINDGSSAASDANQATEVESSRNVLVGG